MALNAGKMSFVVSASAGQLFAGLSQASASVKAFGSVASQVAASVGAAFGGLSAIGFTQWAIGLAAETSKVNAQFTALIGNAGQAQQLLQQIKDIGRTSVIDNQSLAGAARTFMAAGMSIDELVPTIRALTIAGLDNREAFQGMAMQFAKIISQGKVQGDELNVLTEWGWNPLNQIVAKTGETMAEARKRVEQGGVTAREVSQALQDFAGANSKMAGAAAAASQTLSGQYQALQKDVQSMATAFGQRLEPAALATVEAMRGIIEIISGVDSQSALAAAEIIAFAGTFALVVRYSGAVVTAFRAITIATRSMTTAQAVMQAFSGPSGLAKLAVGAIFAAGAVALVDEAFSGVAETAAKASGQSEAAIKQLEKAAKDTVSGVESAKAAVAASTGIVQRHIDSETQARNALKAAIESGNAAAEKTARASLRALEAKNSLELQQAIGGIAKKYDEATLAAERHAKMLERGQQVAEQFATPEQAFATTAQELNDLAAAGAISGDVFDRAFGDATNKLLEARMEAAGLNQELQGVGAAAAGTMEGFRAMAEARRGMEQSQARAAEAAIVQQQIAAMTPQREQGGFSAEMRDILRTQRDILQDILQETKSKEAFTVGTVELY
jgi:tape measure domain-containing protein